MDKNSPQHIFSNGEKSLLTNSEKSICFHLIGIGCSLFYAKGSNGLYLIDDFGVVLNDLGKEEMTAEEVREKGKTIFLQIMEVAGGKAVGN